VLFAVLDLMLRQARAQGHGGAQTAPEALLDAAPVATVLEAALASGSEESLLRLVDERLGRQIALAIAELRQAPRITRWGASQQEQMLLPLWDLTRHHLDNGDHETSVT